jgi:hypothetical protein
MKNLKLTKRKWEFQPSQPVKLMQAYMKGHESLLRTLYHLDKDIQKSQVSKARPLQTISESGAVPHLERLSEHLKCTGKELEIEHAPFAGE